MIKHTTDETFSKIINGDKIVLVDFWADWCGPCKQLSPILDEISKEFADKVVVVKANIDENENTSQIYGIRGVPTMILFKDGHKTAIKVGLSTKKDISDWLEAFSK